MKEMITMSPKEQKRAEIMALLQAGTMPQSQAAELLELSTRQIKRLYRAYKLHGIKGLVSKKREKPSNNRLDEQVVKQVLTRIRERYPDFGPTLAHEKLVEEDGYEISLSSVRAIMIEYKVWLPKKAKKRRIHPRRERRSRYGDLVQIDGSPHDWFEGRAPKCCLIVFIDDATSALLGLRFAEVESTFAYFAVMKSYLKEYGRPQAIYSDKHSIFRVNHGSQMETSQTDFGRAMKDLDIKLICAHSPEAKGRVERANSTLQDRLVKELRLRNISTIDDANAFLPEFLKDHNRRFAVVPKDPSDTHRALDRSHDLERILSIHDTRLVSKSLSFQFESIHFQILEEGYKAKCLIGTRVEVVKTMNGKRRVFSKNRELIFTEAELVKSSPKTLDSKELNSEYEKWLNKKAQYRPPADHPLKRWKLK